MEFTIKNKKIGKGHPVFFIAEAGVNHNGSLELASRLVDMAVEAGADAVKFQTFKAEKLNTKTAPKSSYHVETTGGDQQQTWYELLKTQEMSESMHENLIAYCDQKNIIFLSTPYDEESADLLDKLGVPAFKLASTDTTNLPLIRHIARMKKPFFISTAMCRMEEVRQAVEAVRDEGLTDFAVLQCTGNYPAQIEDSNLKVIETYEAAFNCLVGYSDHTLDIVNPIAAIALGASVYEKHITLDKSLPGPDHRMALSLEELKETIKMIRLTEKALGSKEKYVLDSEQENRIKLRKSLVAARHIAKGTVLKREDIAVKRPGNGISPAQLDQYLGQTIMVDLQEDDLLKEHMFV